MTAESSTRCWTITLPLNRKSGGGSTITNNCQPTTGERCLRCPDIGGIALSPTYTMSCSEVSLAIVNCVYLLCVLSGALLIVLCMFLAQVLAGTSAS